MIRIQNLCKSFGGVQAVNNVSLTIKKGNITSLVGPNGAGKTTLFNLIAGCDQPTSGHIFLEGEDITHLDAHQRFHKGVLRTFQIAHEFGNLTTLENVMMVPSNQRGERLLQTWFHRKAIREEEKRIQHKAEEVLDFLNIAHLKNEQASHLSGGQKKLLELARVLMAEPKIILLDEVGAGVNKTLLRTIGDAILQLNEERGYTFCIIEHDIDFISRLCDPVIVLDQGQILAQGTPDDIKQNEAVADAYLGRSLTGEASV